MSEERERGKWRKGETGNLEVVEVVISVSPVAQEDGVGGIFSNRTVVVCDRFIRFTHSTLK